MFNNTDKLNIDLIYNSINKFFSTDLLEEKKRLVKIIFDKIIWDSDTKELQIFLHK